MQIAAEMRRRWFLEDPPPPYLRSHPVRRPCSAAVFTVLPVPGYYVLKKNIGTLTRGDSRSFCQSLRAMLSPKHHHSD